jgi:predicted nuclease of predicted toxin-antitoxin system
MFFKTDENLHPDLATLLRQHGHDAMTVWDQNLRGYSDADIATVCKREGRVLVTLDMGFADIRSYPPQDYPGIVVLRLESQNRNRVLAAFARVIPLLAENPPVGKLWIVEETDVRIRGGNQDSGASPATSH